jgi:hypothetical protein
LLAASGQPFYAVVLYEADPKHQMARDQMAKRTSPSSPLAFEASAINGCPSLLEVELFAPQGANERDFILGAEVRFGSMTLSSSDWGRSIEFGLSSAILKLNLVACNITPGTPRLGDQQPTSAVISLNTEKTKKTAVSGKVGSSIKISAAASGASASAKLSAGAETSGVFNTSSTQKQAIKLRDDPIVSLSGNRWRFTAIHSDYMQSRYLGDETLCKIQLNSASAQIEGQLTFFPKDLFLIDIEEEGRQFLDLFRRSPTRSAIAKVLLAKHLRQLNSLAEGGGEIVGSIATLKAERNDE